MTNQNPAFAVTAFVFTHGKKHAVRRNENVIVGKINDSLTSAGVVPATKPRPWTLVTSEDTSVLWVSFTHSNALVGAGSPSVGALLTRPDGVNELIYPRASTGNPNGPGYMKAWKLPSRAASYRGWSLHLITVPEGERLATFEL